MQGRNRSGIIFSFPTHRLGTRTTASASNIDQPGLRGILMKRLLICSLFLSPVVFLPSADAGKKGDEVKEALQALQDYIGGWKGSGTSEKNKSEIWKETASWSWRFKGKDTYLSVEMEKSKLFKGGEMRFLPDSGKYQLTLT